MKITDLKSRNHLPIFLNENNLKGIGAEIGVNRGDFSRRILEKWHGDLLYSIDPWIRNKNPQHGEELYSITKAKLLKFKERSQILREKSKESAARFEDGSMDFCYIDALHKYRHVLEDCDLWWPKIKDGGILCGHDYYGPKICTTKDGSPKKWPHVEVKQAVDEFIADNDLKIHCDGGNNGAMVSSWYIQK